MAEVKDQEQATVQAPDPEDIKREIEAEYSEKYKTEISGLNRKISELTEGFKKLQAEKTAVEKTVEDRVKTLEDDREQARQELARERRGAAIRDEAAKRNIKDKLIKLYLANDWDIETVTAHMDEVSKEWQSEVNRDAATQIATKSHTPKSGTEKPESKGAFEGFPDEVLEASKQFAFRGSAK